ncbi:MAG: peptidylprolyl isomerase, partial [Firmicutes bacterium]|nr:peptidylprolyl isomerase [Bacillota bacterium]
YQALKAIVEAKKREELLDQWIRKQQRSTYVRISDGWGNCDFEYPGWIKE